MRKLLCVVFVLMMSIGLINAQNQSCTYQKYGIINQYTNNMVLEVDDVLKISKYKNTFFININDLSPFSENSSGFNLVVSLKGYDELNEEYVYIGDAIEVVSKKENLIYKGKCLIKSNNELDIYLNNQGHNFRDLLYNKELSFSVYFNNMRTDREGFIPQVPNTSIRIYPIRNKTEQEKEEEALKEKQKQAEQERQKEEVTEILSTINENIIKATVHNYYENKLLKESEDWDVLEKPRKAEIDTIVNVLICVDSLNAEVVSIAGDIINNKLNNLYWKHSEHHYCTIDGTNYSKYQNSVFYTEIINIKTKSLEKGMYGVEKKKDKFKYYKTIPSEIQEWCQKNITKNGFYAIEYTNYDGQYIIKTITVNKDEKKILQAKDPQKAKKTWRTAGSIGGSILLLGALIALNII